ncbi:MAG TPA: SDR family oxidoreductase [Pyrinomonadaceae bacterium]|nr:SDR family oxidoreductase [Pyrinomonadaceae bacterium]
MLSQETIFLTGFPGFIAARLIKELARGGARFLLLVQPAFVSHACRETARLAEEAGVEESGRFQIVEGDITRPRLGMSEAEFGRACAETTVLFHLAAIYDLGVRRELAMRVNVEGTRNVNEFARACARLKRYHYVSTCYVAGLRTGVIREDELEHGAGFRNFYEETKYLAELEVGRLKGELPLTIHRPSVVCGDSRTGETAKYDGIYYLIKYLLMRPGLLSLVNIGNRDVRLNVVPVDFVVGAMAALARDERASGATVQLADPRPLTTGELFETIAHALAGRGSRVRLPKPLVRAMLRLPLSEKLSKLPRVGVPYFFLEQTYDTTRAVELLAPHGISCPPFPSYARALIDFAARHPKL